jgi:aminoglycoside phosphotransferase family enzyme/predicted kinase
MIVEDQSDAVAFLAAPATYGTLAAPATYGAKGPVETIETHISRIFLVGDRAFKMKKAVKLPYVDFSTAAIRRAACEKEVRLNSGGAPGLYLGVRDIVRRDGRLAFDGTGDPIDSVVEMMRFDQADLADRMAVDGRLTEDLMTRTARMIARFHAEAPVVHAGTGKANIAAVLDINAAGFATSHVFEAAAVAALATRFRDGLAARAERLDRREAAGKVRRCHGDLHLRNICIPEGRPQLFDCIEFNDAIATVDTLYDLAFLLMDLWHRGFSSFANLVANRYLDAADDEDGFVLLPYFMAVRAAVRAHVTATQAEDAGPDAGRLAAEARSYFDLADALLGSSRPRLIAIGGFSGSGKTTVAERLAPHLGMPPGARIIESDRIRKALHGVTAETRLPSHAYLPEVSRRVYDRLGQMCRDILADGGTVVTDAVFDRLEDRQAIEAIARACAVPFSGLWLDAGADLLRARVAARHGGPSDADVPVLERQLARDPGVIDWQKVESGMPGDQLLARLPA